MATLKDLSALTGISVTQISRALNGHSDVSEDTKKRVRDAAKTLNYHPNISARSLRTGRTGIVALVLPKVPPQPSGSYYMQAVAEMSKAFALADFQFVLHVSPDERDVLTSYRRMIESGSVDGFVLHGMERDDIRIPFLKDAGIPFAAHGRSVDHPDYPYFDIDNRYVGHKLATALIARGHRRIAFLNGPRGRTYAHDRYQGYLEAHREAGIVPDPALHREGLMTEEFGAIETFRLMEAKGGRPSAIISGNMRITKGIIHSLRLLSLRVPADVSLVAHDDALEEESPGGFGLDLTRTLEPLVDSFAPLAHCLIGAIAGANLRTLQKVKRPRFLSQGSIATIAG
jgi:LacI family transcriptional regulator